MTNEYQLFLKNKGFQNTTLTPQQQVNLAREFNTGRNAYQDTDYGVTFEDFQGDTAYDAKVTPGVNPNAWGMKDVATGVNAVTGLANAFLGYKNYGLAKDTLTFNKAATNRDIANQGLAYNTALENNAKIGARLGGLNADQTASKMGALESKKMNISAIG